MRKSRLLLLAYEDTLISARFINGTGKRKQIRCFWENFYVFPSSPRECLREFCTTNMCFVDEKLFPIDILCGRKIIVRSFFVLLLQLATNVYENFVSFPKILLIKSTHSCKRVWLEAINYYVQLWTESWKLITFWLWKNFGTWTGNVNVLLVLHAPMPVLIWFCHGNFSFSRCHPKKTFILWFAAVSTMFLIAFYFSLEQHT